MVQPGSKVPSEDLLVGGLRIVAIIIITTNTNTITILVITRTNITSIPL